MCCALQAEHGVHVCDSMSLTHAGGLLSRDSPFLDIILEGVKLRLPLAGVAYPRVEPAIGAALLVHDALYGADEAPSSIEEAACSSLSRDGSPPRYQDRHGVHPGSHGEVIFEPEGGLHKASFPCMKMMQWKTAPEWVKGCTGEGMSCGLQSSMEIKYSEARFPHRQAFQQGWGLGGQPKKAQEGGKQCRCSLHEACNGHASHAGQQQRGWAWQRAAAGPRQAPP